MTLKGPVHRMNPSPPEITRREMLCRCANGFGGLALATLLAEKLDAAAATNPLAQRPPHFAPKAKSVIFLFMDGGPSQMDTFDPKPQAGKGSWTDDSAGDPDDRFQHQQQNLSVTVSIQEARPVRRGCQRTVSSCGDLRR